MYSKSVLSLSRVSFVDIGNSFAEVVLGSRAVVDAFEPKDGLVGVLVLS